MSELINGDAGRIGFLIKGEYSDNESYGFLDVVYRDGCSYVAKKDTIGNPPENSNEYWQILALAGTGSPVLGIKGETEEEYRAGYVSLSASDVGAIPEEKSDGYAKKSIYGDNKVSLGVASGSITGSKSFAFGYNVEASGYASTATGVYTKATGNQDHAEGCYTTASGNGSHAECYRTTASGSYSHTEGAGTIATEIGSHSEGCQTISGAHYILGIESIDTDTKKITFSTSYDNFDTIFPEISIGDRIHVMNIRYVNEASTFTVESIDSENNSVIVNEEIPTNFNPGRAVLIKAYGINSCHAEGKGTTASANGSHAEGYFTTASGNYSHAGGYYSEAKCTNSIAQGSYVVAGSNCQLAIGRYNTDDNTPGYLKNLFIVGVGTDTDNRANAFRVHYTGEVYGKAAYNSSGADYAEFIKEWWDGNTDNEDRVGYFVTVKDGYLYKANQGDYIVGITSGNPSVVGNSDEEYYWRWERDEFNRIIYEDMDESTEDIDENGCIGGIMQKVAKQSKDYDSNLQQSYIGRKDRKEWDYVGMVGVVPVRDDGTCKVGKYCQCGQNGIATMAEQRNFDTYMVLERITDNVVSVILK